MGKQTFQEIGYECTRKLFEQNQCVASIMDASDKANAMMCAMAMHFDMLMSEVVRIKLAS